MQFCLFVQPLFAAWEGSKLTRQTAPEQLDLRDLHLQLVVVGGEHDEVSVVDRVGGRPVTSIERRRVLSGVDPAPVPRRREVGRPAVGAVVLVSLARERDPEPAAEAAATKEILFADRSKKNSSSTNPP